MDYIYSTVLPNKHQGFESPLKNVIPNPRSGRKDPEEGSHLWVSSPNNDTDNSESDYRSPDDESDKPERWLSQVKPTKNSVRDGRRAMPRPVDKARGSRNQNRRVRATFADSLRPAARPHDYTTRDTVWSW